MLAPSGVRTWLVVAGCQEKLRLDELLLHLRGLPWMLFHEVTQYSHSHVSVQLEIESLALCHSHVAFVVVQGLLG